MREYLHAEQLAVLTPWSVEAIEKMVRRGTFRAGVHYFQPLGRGTKKLFKWTAVVKFIEGDISAEPELADGLRIDVRGLTHALQGLLD